MMSEGGTSPAPAPATPQLWVQRREGPVLLPTCSLRTTLGSVPAWLELNSRPRACLSGFPAPHTLQAASKDQGEQKRCLQHKESTFLL